MRADPSQWTCGLVDVVCVEAVDGDGPSVVEEPVSRLFEALAGPDGAGLVVDEADGDEGVAEADPVGLLARV